MHHVSQATSEMSEHAAMATLESDFRSDSDSESTAEPGPAQKVKLAYRTSFLEEWKKTWPFHTSVPCDKELSCAHQGISDVKDHVASQSLLATQPKLPFACLA